MSNIVILFRILYLSTLKFEEQKWLKRTSLDQTCAPRQSKKKINNKNTPLTQEKRWPPSIFAISAWSQQPLPFRAAVSFCDHSTGARFVRADIPFSDQMSTYSGMLL